MASNTSKGNTFSWDDPLSLDAQLSYSLVYADLGEGYDEAGRANL